jgi:hypothetical protein
VVDNFAVNIPTIVVTQIPAIDKEIILLSAPIELVIRRNDQEVHVRVRPGKSLRHRPSNDQGVESRVVPVCIDKPINGTAVVGLEFHAASILAPISPGTPKAGGFRRQPANTFG